MRSIQLKVLVRDLENLPGTTLSISGSNFLGIVYGIVNTLAEGMIRLTMRFKVTKELVHDEQARGGDADDGWKAFL